MPENPGPKSERATRSGSRTLASTSEGRETRPPPPFSRPGVEAVSGRPAVVTMMSP